MKDDAISTLESVNGRKNPSQAQVKQLKRCIPNTTILKVLISSQVKIKKILIKLKMSKFYKFNRHLELN